ncbi:MAG TPA: hypothetical protein PKI14_14555 [Fervidobacterium sp.]|nr:hypothetical protein [Bacillota bacterium]HUM44160.1 hypothetical protein [Fervidobacterium sp.]
MKTQVPYILTVAAVVLIVVSVFFTFIPGVSVEIDQWYILGTAMVCCVGLVNLTSVHIKNIKRKGRDWDLSILLIVLTFGYLIYGLVKGPTDELYAWIFDSTEVPLGATFYSVLAFYIVSAAYRAFRAKTRDAAILLIAAVIVLLGRAPLTEAIFPFFGTATTWIMDIPNTAAQRGVILCAYLGAFITAIRVFLGLERPYASIGE